MSYVRVMGFFFAVRANAGDGVDVEVVVAKVCELGVLGWVWLIGELHVEGLLGVVDELLVFVGAEVFFERVWVEGYEQFAIRGVSVGVFVV